MAEAGTEDTAKVKKVVEVEETIKANAKCLTSKEVQSNEEESVQVSSLEENDDSNKKCLNSADAFPSSAKCNKDISQNSKDPCSADDNTSKSNDSKNEIDNIVSVVNVEKKKTEENDPENKNSNVVVVSEEIEKSNGDTQVECKDEKHINSEQPTDNKESLMEEKNETKKANEEKVLETVEIANKINKEYFNSDDEIMQEEGTRELKKESIEKKLPSKVEGQLEVGIVGPPTAVSDLISEEELHGESALSTEEKVQDHVAEWVEKSVVTEALISGEIEEEKNENANNCQRRRRNLRDRRSRKKESEDVSVVSIRKSQRIVSNIIKRSIKW